MWEYEKKLQYPVKIKNTNAKLAKFVMSQYGGLYSVCLYYKLTISFLNESIISSIFSLEFSLFLFLLI